MKHESPRKKLPVVLFFIIVMAISALLLFSLMTGNSGNDADSHAIQNVAETINQTGAVGEMNKSSQSLIFFSAVILLPVLFVIVIFMVTYNSLVTNEEDVLGSWAQVETNIQRRMDLIPNLVATVKSFMEHEKEVLTDVTESRAGGLAEVLSALENISSNENLSTLNKEMLADDAFMKALASEQARVGQHVNKLLGVVENYPDLRSSDNFMALQSQLEGTENRINVARIVFNDAVRDYNSSIRKIPGSLVAGVGDFKRKAYFQADGDSKSVDVKF